MLRRQFLSLAPQAAVLASAPALISSAWAQEGVSAKTLSIGCSGALTGPLAGYGTSLKAGIEAAMAQINAKGGVHGRAMQLQMVDDAYNPARTVENVKKMVADSSVFALMSCIGTPNNTALLPLIDETNLPYVAPLTGASSLRKSGARNVFHVRASYTDETQRLMAKVVGMGINNIAIIYLDNGYGKEVLGDAQRTLAVSGVKPVAELALALDGKNIDDVVARTIASKPSAVFLGTAGAASAGLVLALKKASALMPIAGLSATFTAEGIAQLGKLASGIAIAMVMPDATRGRLQVVRDYQAAMLAVGKNDFGSGSLEGYINTRVLAEGLQRTGRDASRAKLRAALTELRNLDLGGFSVNYAAAPYVGSKFVEMGVLNETGRFNG
jgi:branched-chain amino acid transport system substrate-binding protein